MHRGIFFAHVAKVLRGKLFNLDGWGKLGDVKRVLLLVKNKQSRQILEVALTKFYEIIPEETEEPLKSEFDLAVIDGPTLKRWRSKVRVSREDDEPVFLPFLLLTVRRGGTIPLRNLGRLVDDVIVKPINRDELRARVANLMRRRELSLNLKKEHDQVSRLSVTDDVTGFNNTRWLHRFLDKFYDSSKAETRQLSLVFFDVDNFKEVVDIQGHLNGAKVLREIAQAVNRVLDTEDHIVRYGGDEYVVVLPDQAKEAALEKVELMRRAISSTRFLHKEGLDVRVTASFGVATSPDDAMSAEELLGAADECLFKSKRGGKNQITVKGQCVAEAVIEALEALRR